MLTQQEKNLISLSIYVGIPIQCTEFIFNNNINVIDENNKTTDANNCYDDGETLAYTFKWNS